MQCLRYTILQCSQLKDDLNGIVVCYVRMILYSGIFYIHKRLAGISAVRTIPRKRDFYCS